MYIACQSRDGDLDTFFEHENHAWPPSLASNDRMNQTAKSDLVGVLESLAPISDHIPDIDVKLIDGAALVHCLDPKRSRYKVKTFQEYAQLVFLPHLALMLQDVVRLDVVWDIYRKDSLKLQNRQSRGVGNRLLLSGKTSIPINWKNFLRVDANKEGLFRLLAVAVQEFQPPAGKTIISTLGEHAVSSPVLNLQELQCKHEEADTRLLFHAFHASKNGLVKIMIHASDTDVVVIAIAASRSMPNCELWVAFGHGATLRYIPCHMIAASLGDEASQGLLFLHALSGCDTVSSFHGIGKKTAWSGW